MEEPKGVKRYGRNEWIEWMMMKPSTSRVDTQQEQEPHQRDCLYIDFRNERTDNSLETTESSFCRLVSYHFCLKHFKGC